jgi:hypothetical protein
MWVRDGGDLLDTVRQNNVGWILTCSKFDKTSTCIKLYIFMTEYEHNPPPPLIAF